MASGSKRRRPALGPAAISLGIHGAILAAVLTWTAKPPLELFMAPPDLIPITLAPPQPTPEPAAADDDPAPTPPAKGAPRVAVRPPLAPPPPTVAPLPATPAPPAPMQLATLSDAELAGARTVGSGAGGSGAGAGGGQDCDMVRRLQEALRKDPDVRAAVAQARASGVAGGRALLVWDGDWVLSPGQSGKGLAGVRQAIVMEVAFAPAACRAEPMSGLVVLSLDDRAGRLALGAGRWRWSDLLAARRG